MKKSVVLWSRTIRDIEILPKDSAWVFVEASLTPNNQTLPALVRDSLLFEVNGNEQFVQLAAYGWDAYYLKDTVFNQSVNLLPSSLLHLSFGRKFNQPIDNLPSSLTHLSLGEETYDSVFNQPINNLPKRLQRLVLPKNYDKPTDHVSDLLQNKRVKY